MASAALTALGSDVFAWAGDSPGFYWGSDSQSSPSDTSAPYTEPLCGGHGSGDGAYGAYLGKIGGADLMASDNPNGASDGKFIHQYSVTGQTDANADHFDYGQGAGAGVFWWGEGPLLNPNYDESLSPAQNAYNWGLRQGNAAVADVQAWWHNGQNRLPFQALFIDIEDDNNGNNGWYGAVQYDVRRTFDGFFDAVSTAGTGWSPGMYSARSKWGNFSGPYYKIPSTWEWTFQAAATTAYPCPQGWTDGTLLATFFGGQTQDSDHAIAWQWCGGICNDGTFDQVYFNRLPAGW